MKKLFFVAAAAALALASCLKSNVPEGTARITLKIAGASSSTRAVETAATNPVKPILDPAGNHHVYVINAGTVLHVEALDLSAVGTATGQVIGATADAGGQKYFPTTSSVYVLGNVPSDISVPSLGVGTAESALYAAVSEISYSSSRNTDYTKPAMANDTGAAAVVTPGSANDASVNIDLKPLYSRIELKAIQGGSHIKSYTVTGVYLNNYNTKFTLAGTGDATSLKTTTANPPYASTWFGDNAKPINSTPSGDLTAALVPDAGMVWAYSVAPGSIATFIIELDNIVQYPDNSGTADTTNPTPVTGKKYVTVTGYTGMSDATFMRGKIYQVGTVNFNWDDLKATPTPTGVAITAVINVLNWDFEPLNPQVL